MWKFASIMAGLVLIGVALNIYLHHQQDLRMARQTQIEDSVKVVEAGQAAERAETQRRDSVRTDSIYRVTHAVELRADSIARWKYAHMSPSEQLAYQQRTAKAEAARLRQVEYTQERTPVTYGTASTYSGSNGAYRGSGAGTYVGPRGGVYHLSASGRKVYEKH